MNFSRLQAVYNSFGMKTIQVKTGQLLEIHETIGEGDNKRNWKFKCLVYGVKNAGHPNGTFLVRGISSGVVIEKIYPLCFEKFSKIILLDEFKVRRSKIYFLRHKVGKGARLKSIITSERRNMDLLTLQIVPVMEEVEVPAALIDENLDTVTIDSVEDSTPEVEATTIETSDTQEASAE